MLALCLFNPTRLGWWLQPPSCHAACSGTRVSWKAAMELPFAEHICIMLFPHQTFYWLLIAWAITETGFPIATNLMGSIAAWVRGALSYPQISTGTGRLVLESAQSLGRRGAWVPQGSAKHLGLSFVWFYSKLIPSRLWEFQIPFIILIQTSLLNTQSVILQYPFC